LPACPTSAAADLFLRDLNAGATSLLSVAINGTAAGNALEDPPQFSPDGRYVAFLSSASTMVAGVPDLNGATDLFVRDRQAGATLLVSHNHRQPRRRLLRALPVDARWQRRDLRELQYRHGHRCCRFQQQQRPFHLEHPIPRD